MPTVAIVAPVGRDAQLTRDLLRRIGVGAITHDTIGALCEAGFDDAGALILTEEALETGDVPRLTAALAAQPGWSDVPILVFAGGDRSRASMRTLKSVEALTNVTLIERPIRVAAVFSVVRSALRARERQYEMRDILVNLHAARTEAERASRLKDEFLATLSHELRTPLNAILGWTAMLRKNHVEPERVPRVHEILERNATAQAQLIADVLDVSRMITGKLRLHVRPMSLVAVIRDAVETVRLAADAKEVRLVVDVEAELTALNGDPDRLQQVVWNLLSNAVKFTPAGGEVRVSLKPSAEFVEVLVTDSGVGLTPDFLPHAFERFRQADQSFTRAHGGLGLGLAIVKHVVEMHGGEVAVASDGPDRGATFSVKLPRTGATDETPVVDRRRAPRPAAGRMPDLNGRLILVVDDDEATRELMMAMLTKLGARVQTAASAGEAMARVDAEVPALIVADIGMPGEDGLSMFRRLRHRTPAQGGDVPAVALSAYARHEDRQAALSAGFDAFVAKPAEPAELLATIERTLGAR